MTYSISIIGTGSVGKALAGQFLRNGISIGIANSRGPDSVASIFQEQAKACAR
jgi:predicted dinucleotide-binding enzyme